MLRVKKVKIKGFGPYVDQEIEFSQNPGINIIWGDNGYGKTTFINALKFGFYGELPDKKNLDRSILSLINVHNRDKGIYDFNVIIEFDVGDDDYILTRFAELKYRGTKPEGYNDFNIEFHLQKNGDLLPMGEGKKILESIMPENTSRFFIFDGELLEEYNKLTNEDETSLNLKKSIEQILGLPILTNSKRHIDTLKDNVSKTLIDLNKQKARDKTNYDKYEKEKANLKENLELKESLEKDKIKYAKQYDEIYDELKKGPSGDKLKEHEKLENELNIIRSNLQAKKDDIKDIVLGNWKGLTHNRLLEKKEAASLFNKEYEEKKKQYDSYQRDIDRYSLSLTKQSCETCYRSLGEKEISIIKQEITRLRSKLPQITDKEHIIFNENEKMIKIIDNKLISYKTQEAILKNRKKEIVDLEIDEYDKKTQKNDIEKMIHNFSQEKETNVILEKQKENALKNLTNVTESLKQVNLKIEETNEKIKKYEIEIKRQIDNKELENFKEKDKLLNDFSSLLDEGIDVFRNELKNRVEADAGDLFVKFANQKDFKSLKINDNYGLDIVHSTDQIVPVKSSGYSHIVSLCLIGALHKNAPIQGPVFIDSPSGRLDAPHKKNFINILTHLSDQVVLLLYNGELDDQLIRKNLSTSLRGEYELIHANDDAFITIIKER